MKHVNNREYLEIIEEIARKHRKLEELKTNPLRFNRLALSILKDIQRLIDALVLARKRKDV